MQPQNQSPERFTVLDWIGVWVAGLNALALAAFPIEGRTFTTMFKDLASDRDLPLLTRLATSTWFPILLTVPVVAALVLALRGNGRLATRRAWVLAAFVVGSVSFGVCLIGVYLPIFAIARAVQAE